MNPLFLLPIKPNEREVKRGLCLKTLKIDDILDCFEISQHFLCLCVATCIFVVRHFFKIIVRYSYFFAEI